MTTMDSRPAGLALDAAWVDVVSEAELGVEIGVPALVAGTPVAVFRTHDGALHAVSNLDPKTGASVMARGIVGSRGDVPTLASPLYKDVFDLRTGQGLDDPALALECFAVRVRDGVVQVRGT